MAQHFYNNVSNEGELSAGVGTGTAIFTLTGAGLGTIPAIPFYVRVDPDQATEEVCEVTVGSTPTSLNVTRGYDGTSAFSHGIGAKVRVCVPAEFYNKADAHVEASTNVHGLAGGAAVVGTTSTQTLTNKTINASVLDLAHSTSPAASQAVKVSADAATARDGYTWDNTGGSTGRAFVARSGGADKFVVEGDGDVVASGTASVAGKADLNGQVEMGLQAPATATTRFITRVRPTQAAWELKDQGGFNIASVGASGNIDASGYIATASTLSSGGAATLNSLGVTNNATVSGTLAVTGTSTLTGNVTLPLPAAGTTQRLVINSRTGGTNIEGRNQAGTDTFYVRENGEIGCRGRALIYNNASPAIAQVTSTASVGVPQTDMVVFDSTDGFIKRYNGATWDSILYYGDVAGSGHARYYNDAVQSIPNDTNTKVTFPDTITSHADITRDGGFDDFTINRAGLWLIETTVSFAGSGTSTPRAVSIRNSATTALYGVSQNVNFAGGGTSLSTSCVRNFAVSDTIAVIAYHAAGVAIDTQVTSEMTHVSFTWLRP